jgi:hypothetical protein
MGQDFTGQGYTDVFRGTRKTATGTGRAPRSAIQRFNDSTRSSTQDEDTTSKVNFQTLPAQEVQTE